MVKSAASISSRLVKSSHDHRSSLACRNNCDCRFGGFMPWRWSFQAYSDFENIASETFDEVENVSPWILDKGKLGQKHVATMHFQHMKGCLHFSYSETGLEQKILLLRTFLPSSIHRHVHFEFSQLLTQRRSSSAPKRLLSVDVKEKSSSCSVFSCYINCQVSLSWRSMENIEHQRVAFWVQAAWGVSFCG